MTRSGCRKFAREGFVVAFVEFEFGVIEIEVCEYAVFLHQEIGKDGARCVAGMGFANALLTLHEEVELRVESRAVFSGIEVGEEGIVFAVVDAARMKAFSEDAGEGGLADAQGTFNDNKARWLQSRVAASVHVSPKNQKRAFCLWMTSRQLSRWIIAVLAHPMCVSLGAGIHNYRVVN